jgi:hypothetical protein
MVLFIYSVLGRYVGKVKARVIQGQSAVIRQDENSQGKMDLTTPKGIFMEINKAISKFLWENKAPG